MKLLASRKVWIISGIAAMLLGLYYGMEFAHSVLERMFSF